MQTYRNYTHIGYNITKHFVASYSDEIELKYKSVYVLNRQYEQSESLVSYDIINGFQELPYSHFEVDGKTIYVDNEMKLFHSEYFYCDTVITKKVKPVCIRDGIERVIRNRDDSNIHLIESMNHLDYFYIGIQSIKPQDPYSYRIIKSVHKYNDSAVLYDLVMQYFDGDKEDINSIRLLRQISSNRFLSIPSLKCLMKHPSHIVRLGILENPRKTRDIVEALQKDEDWRVVMKASDVLQEKWREEIFRNYTHFGVKSQNQDNINELYLLFDIHQNQFSICSRIDDEFTLIDCRYLKHNGEMIDTYNVMQTQQFIENTYKKKFWQYFHLSQNRIIKTVNPMDVEYFDKIEIDAGIYLLFDANNILYIARQERDNCNFCTELDKVIDSRDTETLELLLEYFIDSDVGEAYYKEILTSLAFNPNFL
ncbi:MAG: hypothetical protein U9R50_02835 [Campylobacterota bacterium]|nr:hypothetical protein [Campylobacterota bacterium]